MQNTKLRALLVISPEKYRDEELNHTKQALERNGVEVMVASTRTGSLEGMLGHVENVDKSLADVAGENYDAVVVVGGSGAPGRLWDNARLREILRRHHAMGKVVAGICLGCVAVAKAGLLRGIEATVYKSPESIKVLREHGAIYKNCPVVVSGFVITGAGPAAAREFGLAIVKVLNKSV